jgi:Methylase involved in ubiquinone/menaquinone biosynthesis
LIKRTSLHHINSILKQNQDWNILDVGCGYSAHSAAKTICDVQNLRENYKNKNFIQLKEKKFPFNDKEFDFVIASHVIEHVEDVDFFLKELERVSKKGYIEVPTKLEDNLVFENKNDHVWHIDFDDINNKLVISKRAQYIEPILTVSSIKKLNGIFRKSLVLELFWEDKINYSVESSDTRSIEKISLYNLLRKYVSKKIRMLFR